MQHASVRGKPSFGDTRMLGNSALQWRGNTRNQATTVPLIARDMLRSPRQPLDAPTHTYMEPRFAHNFSTVPVHANMRTSRQANAWEFNDRFDAESEDPVHQPILDAFRTTQGQPPGGVDPAGNRVGPTDAEIKYGPQPIAVLNGPFHAPFNARGAVGMEIQITVKSSSGNNADMASVRDSEQVSPSLNHTGSFATVPQIVSSTSDFMPAVNIPNDRHGSSRANIIDRADNHGGNGSWDYQQLDIYTDVRRGVVNPVAIPNSGYRITRTIIAGPGNRLAFKVEKSPEACTVNGFSTTAGPSPAQHDEVILRR